MTLKPLLVVRILAAICVLLSLACFVLARAATQARERADCWRAYAEQDGPPAEGDCRARR